MTTPATILRDSAIAGLLLSLLGGLGGVEVAGSIAAGALGSLVNLGLLVRLVNGADPQMSALFLARLMLKHLAGAVILVLLVANLPAGPVLVGFCSVILALAGHAVVGLFTAHAGRVGPANPSTPEPG